MRTMRITKLMVTQNILVSILSEIGIYSWCQWWRREWYELLTWKLLLFAAPNMTDALNGFTYRDDVLFGWFLWLDLRERRKTTSGWWFSIQLGIIIRTDELIFFRGVGILPTRYIWLKKDMISDSPCNHSNKLWQNLHVTADWKYMSVTENDVFF